MSKTSVGGCMVGFCVSVNEYLLALYICDGWNVWILMGIPYFCCSDLTSPPSKCSLNAHWPLPSLDTIPPFQTYIFSFLPLPRFIHFYLKNTILLNTKIPFCCLHFSLHSTNIDPYFRSKAITTPPLHIFHIWWLTFFLFSCLQQWQLAFSKFSLVFHLQVHNPW